MSLDLGGRLIVLVSRGEYSSFEPLCFALVDPAKWTRQQLEERVNKWSNEERAFQKRLSYVHTRHDLVYTTDLPKRQGTGQELPGASRTLRCLACVKAEKQWRGVFGADVAEYLARFYDLETFPYMEFNCAAPY